MKKITIPLIIGTIISFILIILSGFNVIQLTTLLLISPLILAFLYVIILISYYASMEFFKDYFKD